MRRMGSEKNLAEEDGPAEVHGLCEQGQSGMHALLELSV